MLSNRPNTLDRLLNFSELATNLDAKGSHLALGRNKLLIKSPNAVTESSNLLVKNPYIFLKRPDIVMKRLNLSAE